MEVNISEKDVASLFRVKESRVKFHHHPTPTTKIENILSVIYHGTLIYVTEFDLTHLAMETEFDLTPCIGNSCPLHIKKSILLTLQHQL
jgi:hypothetical protein